VGKVWREFADDEFLEEVGGGGLTDADERVFERQSRAIAILRRIVEVGDAACSETAEDAGIIGLPVSIVALTDHRIRDGIENPGAYGAGAFVEIARILFEERWKDRAADKRADNEVAVRRSVALRVTLRALAVAAESVVSLLHSSDDAGDHKIDRVYGASPRKLKLLFGGERSGIGNVAYIKIWNDAEDALFFLDLEFLFGDFDLRDGDLNLADRGGESQGDWRERENLAGMQNARKFLRGERVRSNDELKRAGCDVRKREFAIFAGQNFLLGCFVIPRERDASPGDSRARGVNDRAADGPGGLRIELRSRLLAELLGRGRRGFGRGWSLLRLSQSREATKQQT
jgi:hypothetical protein